MEQQAEVHTDTDTTDNNLSIVREDPAHVDVPDCPDTVAAKPAEKQEWSFTLYDVDGQGRVTKEEVAQLLKSLYDAIGPSIDLPEAGAKTLKLHLSVSPDKTKSVEEPSTLGHAAEDVDLNCKECNSDKDKMHSHKKDINSKLNNDVAASKLANKRSSWHHGPLKVELPNNLSKEQKDGHVHSSMKRISPLEQKQLAELVKINMQRNREKKQKHGEGKQRQSSAIPLSHILENPDRRSYYLDLAGIENPTSLSIQNPVDSSPMQHAKLRTKSKGASQRRAKENTMSQGHLFTDHVFGPIDCVQTPEKSKAERHHKHSSPSKAIGESPSAVTPGKTRVLKSPHHKRGVRTSSPQKARISRSSPRHEPTRNLNEVKTEHTEQVSETVTSIPKGANVTASLDPSKHRRNKTKDKNHVRAMLKVAQWIEKEHTPGLENVMVEKHEHHHFHEHHHHHHYHHHHQAS